MADARGVEQVVLRQQFYKDRSKVVRFLLMALFAVNVILGLGVFYYITHPVHPQYFPATEDGRVFNMHPLSDPVQNDDFVVQWASTALSHVFALDFLHWRQQLTDVSNDFSPRGWKYFLTAVKKDNNLSTLTNYKMVSSATITGAPQVVQKGVVHGRYMWTVQVPIIIKYSNINKEISQTALVTMKIQRMSVVKYPSRIAIDMLVVNQQAESKE